MGQCARCGETTSPEHSFCLACGAPLVRAQEPPVRTVTAPAPHRSVLDAARTRPPERPTAGLAIPLAVALVLSIALQQLVSSVIPAEAYVYRLFRPAGSWIMGVVPGLIAFVFIWTITDLVLKLRIARVNERDLARPEVARVAAQVAQESTSSAIQHLRGWDGRVLARPVGRRVLTVLQHVDTVDEQRAHELIRHQADLEADAAASGYRTVKLFIWAMPILGFIGTVLGISLAVGGFSDFLTTNVSIDEIDRVTAELGEVASGLSFAFDTTLLGLLGGLFASVMSTAAQGREERLLTSLEELGLRIMESAAAASRGDSADSAVIAMDPGVEFDDMMRARLAQLSTLMDQFTRAVRRGLEGFLGAWAKLPPEVDQVAADLSELRQHLASAAEGIDRLILETRVLLEGVRDSAQRMGTGLEASMGSVGDAVARLGDGLEGVSNGLARNLSSLNEGVVSSEAHLTTALAGLQAAIEQSRRNEEGSADVMHALSASITDLSERLGEFRQAQAALTPILSRLAGPLELRLMQVPAEGEDA